MKKPIYTLLAWCLPLPFVWWAALLCGGCLTHSMGIAKILTALSEAMDAPFAIRWTERFFSFLLVFSLIYGMAVVAVNDK